MSIIIGIVIGLVVGAAQFFLLSKFTKRVTSGSGFVLYGLLQWVLPFAALILIALVYKSALLPAGITIAAVLIIGSVSRVVIGGKK